MELGAPDAKGRRSPVPVAGSNFILECDTAVLAIGYGMDQELTETTSDLKTTKWGTIWVASEDAGEDSGRTSRSDVFAAGDDVHGADLVVTALATARHAARAMHKDLVGV
jgi:glutamate synthase (NADPH/NADH) small chain